MVLSQILNGSLAQVPDLVTLHLVIWKYSCSYLDLLNVDTFHYTRSKKITFVNTTTGLIRKVLILKWEVVKVIVMQVFQNPDFLLKAWIYHCQ